MDATTEKKLLSTKTLDELYRMCRHEDLIDGELQLPRYGLHAPGEIVHRNQPADDFASTTSMREWDTAIQFALVADKVADKISQGFSKHGASRQLREHVIDLYDDALNWASQQNYDHDNWPSHADCVDRVSAAIEHKREHSTFAKVQITLLDDSNPTRWQDRVTKDPSPDIDRSRG